MKPKWTIQLEQHDASQKRWGTCFGGQPDWIDNPQWPSSRRTNKPLAFLGQIELFPELGAHPRVHMAYIFMNNENDGNDATWAPDSGENAVVLQPGKPDFSTFQLQNGPTLSVMTYVAHLQPGMDPDMFDENKAKENDEAWRAYCQHWDDFKLGGSPVFIQYEEYPDEGSWHLLLQIPSLALPFQVNFGAAGVGYVFLNETGDVAKFLWQE